MRGGFVDFKLYTILTQDVSHLSADHLEKNSRPFSDFREIEHQSSAENSAIRSHFRFRPPGQSPGEIRMPEASVQ